MGLITYYDKQPGVVHLHHGAQIFLKDGSCSTFYSCAHTEDFFLSSLAGVANQQISRVYKGKGFIVAFSNGYHDIAYLHAYISLDKIDFSDSRNEILRQALNAKISELSFLAVGAVFDFLTIPPSIANNLNRNSSFVFIGPVSTSAAIVAGQNYPMAVKIKQSKDHLMNDTVFIVDGSHKVLPLGMKVHG